MDTSFVIYVDNIYPSKIKNIDEALEELKSDFIKYKKLNVANKIYDENINNNITSISNEVNSEIENIKLKQDNDILPSVLVKKIFDTDLNKITFFSDDDNVYYIEIKSINIPESNEILQDINLLSEFKNAFGNEIIKTKNISINDELINGLLSQYK